MKLSGTNITQATQIWQELFNHYREKGCPLDDMFDMLIDFKELIKLLEKREEVQFIWACNPGMRFTELINNEKIEQFGIQGCVEHYGAHYNILCQIKDNEATFTKL